MHAEAGDTLEIWLRNLLNVHVNLEPMGNAWNVHGMLQPIQVSEHAWAFDLYICIPVYIYADMH